MNAAETSALFTELGVLQRGHFKLSSGKHSDTYLQCARALQIPSAAMRLGRALADRLSPLAPDVVVSPALGGVLAGFVVAAALDRRFVFVERGADRAMTLRRGQWIAEGERVVVVEDVVTTGGSAMEAAAVCEAAGASVVGLASLVDRSAALEPAERPALAPTSLLAVNPDVWAPESCPLCAEHVPLGAPGSRYGAM